MRFGANDGSPITKKEGALTRFKKNHQDGCNVSGTPRQAAPKKKVTKIDERSDPQKKVTLKHKKDVLKGDLELEGRIRSA